MLIALFPAVKYVLPNESDDFSVKDNAISFVLAVDGDLMSPGRGYPSVVKLVPADASLSVE